jgi:glucose/arabinose dehydrogenase
VPVIAPGNLMFYRGTQTFPQWDGNGFIGGMGTQSLTRVIFDGKGGAEDRRTLGASANAFATVAEAPDGSLWLLEDANAGALIHLTPKVNSSR